MSGAIATRALLGGARAAAALRYLPLPYGPLGGAAIVAGAAAATYLVELYYDPFTEARKELYWWGSPSLRELPIGPGNWKIQCGPTGPVNAMYQIAVACDSFAGIQGRLLIPGQWTAASVICGAKEVLNVGAAHTTLQLNRLNPGGVTTVPLPSHYMQPGLLPAVWYPRQGVRGSPDRRRWVPGWYQAVPQPGAPSKSGIHAGFAPFLATPAPGRRVKHGPFDPGFEAARRVAQERPPAAGLPLVIAGLPPAVAGSRSPAVPVPAPDLVIPGTGNPGKDGSAYLVRSSGLPRAVAQRGLAPPRPGEKEVKFAFRAAQRFAEVSKYNLTTELRDLVEALWDNIPDKCKQFRSKTRLRGKNWRRRRDPREPTRVIGRISKSGRPLLPRMMQDVWDHWDCISWGPWTEAIGSGSHVAVVKHRGALVDAALNNAEDAFFGALGHAAKKAHARLQGRGQPTAGFQFGGGLMNRRAASALGVPSPIDWAADFVGL